MIVEPYVFEGLSSDDEPVVIAAHQQAATFARDVVVFVVGFVVGAIVGLFVIRGWNPSKPICCQIGLKG